MQKTFNPETNELPVERELRFVVRDHSFRLAVKIPLYIKNALTDSDWQEIMLELEQRATVMLRNAAARGWLGQDARDVITPALCFVAREMIYHHFKIRQQRVGNEAWEVPEALGQGLMQMPGVEL